MYREKRVTQPCSCVKRRVRDEVRDGCGSVARRSGNDRRAHLESHKIACLINMVVLSVRVLTPDLRPTRALHVEPMHEPRPDTHPRTIPCTAGLCSTVWSVLGRFPSDSWSCCTVWNDRIVISDLYGRGSLVRDLYGRRSLGDP